MASVEDLKQLNRDQLNEFALLHGIEDAEDTEVYKTKEALATVLSPKVTPEQLKEFVALKAGGAPVVDGSGEIPADGTYETAVDPALPGADQSSLTEPVDPATQPPEAEAESDGELKIGDRVSYPFDGVEGNRLMGTVRGTGEGFADVVGYDGATRTFPLSQLQRED